MQRDPLVLAYLAGMIDGDGFISVQRTTAKATYFGPVIGIAGTRREPHDLAANVWGGSVSRYVPENTRHRPQFQWSRYGAAAVQAINDVYKFLRIKTAQADVVIELWGVLEDRRQTREDPFPWFGPDYDPIDDLTRLADECGALNQWRRRAGRLLDGVEHNEFPPAIVA